MSKSLCKVYLWMNYYEWNKQKKLQIELLHRYVCNLYLQGSGTVATFLVTFTNYTKVKSSILGYLWYFEKFLMTYLTRWDLTSLT